MPESSEWPDNTTSLFVIAWQWIDLYDTLMTTNSLTWENTVAGITGTAAVTRRQLIDSGQLLDVTRLARAHRIVVPTTITLNAWKACGGRLSEFATAGGDQLAGRILAAARAQAINSRPSSLANPVLGFALENPTGMVELELEVGPDDDGTPAATIDVAGY